LLFRTPVPKLRDDSWFLVEAGIEQPKQEQKFLTVDCFVLYTDAIGEIDKSNRHVY
jgi:hypothetical protein